jgi:cytochrome b involved in lipid metabolism
MQATVTSQIMANGHIHNQDNNHPVGTNIGTSTQGQNTYSAFQRWYKEEAREECWTGIAAMTKRHDQ